MKISWKSTPISFYTPHHTTIPNPKNQPFPAPKRRKVRTHLKLRPQPHHDPPKYLHANLKHLRHRAHRVPAQRQTEVLVRHVDEGHGLARGGGVDERGRVHEYFHVRVEDDEDHVEGEEFGAHAVRFHFAFAEGGWGRAENGNMGGKRRVD